MPRRFLDTVATTTSTAAALSPAPPMSRDSDVVVILAALLCAVICVGGLALVARCAWLRRNGFPAAATVRSPPSPSKRIKKKVLLSVPTLSYQEAFARDEGCGRKMSSDCAICLTEFAEGDEIRVLPQCGHGFHSGCVDVWLGSHSSCPSCRRPLVVTSGRCGAGVDAMPSVGVVVGDMEEERREERKASGDASGSGGFLA